MSHLKEIKYRVDGKIAIISFESPKNLNALSFEHYQYLSLLLERADEEPDTVVTLITSSGKFFSAGADIERNHKFTSQKFDDKQQKRDAWKDKFLANNILLTKNTYKHKKILAVALNGSVIGLSAAVVAMADVIFAKSEKFYMLLPFANLGLVSEGSASVTLFHRLGLSKANEALLLSRPIKGDYLNRIGFLNKVYNIDNVDEYNKKVTSDLQDWVQYLHPDSIFKIKKLIQNNVAKSLALNNIEEAGLGLELFEEGQPQARFAKLRSKQLSHKL